MRIRALLVGIAAIAAAAGLGWLGAAGRTEPPTGEGRVTRVVDGDTLHVRVGGAERTIRVIGIDTPEVAHGGEPAACDGERVATTVRSALLGHQVRLTEGVEPRDRFGRTLAWVAIVDGPLAGRDLSEELARRGLARPLAIAPNDGRAATIDRLVDDARRAGRGLWGACGFAAAFPGKAA